MLAQGVYVSSFPSSGDKWFVSAGRHEDCQGPTGDGGYAVWNAIGYLLKIGSTSSIYIHGSTLARGQHGLLIHGSGHTNGESPQNGPTSRFWAYLRSECSSPERLKYLLLRPPRQNPQVMA
jgi:hypothetical protein